MRNIRLRNPLLTPNDKIEKVHLSCKQWDEEKSNISLVNLKTLMRLYMIHDYLWHNTDQSKKNCWIRLPLYWKLKLNCCVQKKKRTRKHVLTTNGNCVHAYGLVVVALYPVRLPFDFAGVHVLDKFAIVHVVGRPWVPDVELNGRFVENGNVLALHRVLVPKKYEVRGIFARVLGIHFGHVQYANNFQWIPVLDDDVPWRPSP